MSDELFPPDGPRWAVLTCYRRQTKEEKLSKDPPVVSHHELLYGTSVQTRRKGEQGFEALREMAKFLNRQKLIPRDRIQCAADAPNLDKYLRDTAP